MTQDDPLISELERRIDWQTADKIAREVAQQMGDMSFETARKYGYCIHAPITRAGRTVDVELWVYGRRKVKLEVVSGEHHNQLPGVFDGRDKRAIAAAAASALRQMAVRVAP